MGKKRVYLGETFEFDDSKGCYIEVSYRGLVGYAGVNLDSGTRDAPYSWTAPGIGGNATGDGLSGGMSVL